jgi:hypothetical protein
MPRLAFDRHAAGALPPSTDLTQPVRCRGTSRGVIPERLLFTHERTLQGLEPCRSTPQAPKQARAPRIRARIGGVDLSDGRQLKGATNLVRRQARRITWNRLGLASRLPTPQDV